MSAKPTQLAAAAAAVPDRRERILLGGGAPAGPVNRRRARPAGRRAA
ncbi:hypothetical protein ACWGE1_21000 [Streptomyces sp. NPDC054932]